MFAEFLVAVVGLAACSSHGDVGPAPSPAEQRDLSASGDDLGSSDGPFVAAELATDEDLATPSPGDVQDLASAPAADLATGISIVADPIPYGATRQSEMATYSLHHYGASTSALAPKQIVLHFTDSSTYSSAFNTFSADMPNRGELPGTCAHFIVDKDGTIYQLVDLGIRCRHAVGVNHVALGIEMVQESLGKGGAWADGQILARAAQVGSVLRLVHWLQSKYAISSTNVIGHAMANGSSFFEDLEGWTNDHVDWLEPDVIELRSRLALLP